MLQQSSQLTRRLRGHPQDVLMVWNFWGSSLGKGKIRDDAERQHADTHLARDNHLRDCGHPHGIGPESA